MAYFRHWRSRFLSSSEQIGHAIPPMAKIYSCQKILTDETEARGSSSHSRTIGQLSEALIFSRACFRADIIQRHADWLGTGRCLGLPGGREELLRGVVLSLQRKCCTISAKMGLRLRSSFSEGGCRKGSLRISSWYECFIPQIVFLTRTVSEICFWLAKTNCTLKEPQI